LCTSRKRRPPQVSGSKLPRGAQSLVSAAWLRALRKAAPERSASDLYAGRAFATARRAAEFLGADLIVASAGLGIVRGDTVIPSYDLTLARGGIRSRVTGAFDLAAWWIVVSHGPYATELASQLRGRPLILVCLSRAYAPLIVSTLKSACPNTLRIFGAGLEAVLPLTLKTCLLPYDDRLAALTPGTRADFAQRALLHYVTSIYGESTMSLDQDKTAVRAALAKLPKPPRGPKRPSVDDATVRAVIKRLLPTIGRRRSVMLRHLRTVEGIACEQSRFNRLFSEVVGHA
jgi:hypothetical protein